MAKPALLFIAFFAALLIQGGHSKTFIIKNNCQETVWPAILPNPGSAALSQTGFQLNPSASLVVNTPAQWSGRIWARTYCSIVSSGQFRCVTGDCSNGLACVNSTGFPPATRVEFILLGDGGQDVYDVSFVDGFNLPVSVTPKGGTTACTTVSCPLNINAWCPLALQDTGLDGKTIVGCRSACAAFYTSDQYCCRGDYSGPSTCKPSNYSQVFKNLCPQGCSYPNDGATCNFTCMGTEYDITFCP